MAIAGPTPSARDRRELHLMVAEKIAGFGEARNAMVLQSIRANQTLAISLYRVFWTPSPRRRALLTTAVAGQLQSAALDIFDKGLAPIHRKVVGNAKRLARRKLWWSARVRLRAASQARLHHVPGSASYERTQVDIAKGERWFCIEADAKAAGWRAPKN